MPIGKLTDFSLVSGSWTTYTERLQQYFVVNEVKPELRVPTLISCVDDSTYELMVELCRPKKLVTFAFKDLVSIVKKHLKPTPFVLEERYIFKKRMQEAHESVIKYAESLQNLSRMCDFKNNYDENLRDQFIYGLKNEVMRRMLFCEKDLNFAFAVNKAAALESLMKHKMTEIRMPTFKQVHASKARPFRQQKYDIRTSERPSSKKIIYSCYNKDKKHSSSLPKAGREMEDQIKGGRVARSRRHRRLTQRYGIDYSVTYNFKSYLNNVLEALN